MHVERTLHTATVHGTFAKIEHMLGYKTSANFK